MNNLSKSFEVVIEELDKREANLVALEKQLEAKQKELEIAYKEYEDKMHNFLIDKEEVERKMQLIGSEEARKVKEEEIVKGLNDAAIRKLEAIKQENRLVEVKANLDLREAEVTKREVDVSKREVEYKETVKKEFFEELQKRLPR